MTASMGHKEIAEHLGFYDEFHFSKVFHKCMGFSPQEFRARALGGLWAGKKVTGFDRGPTLR